MASDSFGQRCPSLVFLVYSTLILIPQMEIEGEGERLTPELKEINSVAGSAAFIRGLGYAAKADDLYIRDFGIPDSFKKILEEFYWNLPAYDWEKLVG